MTAETILYESIQQEISDLDLLWQNTTEQWHDAVAEEFVANYIEPLREVLCKLSQVVQPQIS